MQACEIELRRRKELDDALLLAQTPISVKTNAAGPPGATREQYGDVSVRAQILSLS